MVQKYSKSLLDSVTMTVESEDIDTLPPNNCKLVFKTLAEDTVLSHGKKQSGVGTATETGLKKSLKVQLCSSQKVCTEDFRKLYQQHYKEIEAPD